jgi:CheY-like chemotaxis protein
MRILLVEDNFDTVQVMQRIISRMGHSVVPAVTLKEAKSTLKSHHFDLVISDLTLPDGNALTLFDGIPEKDKPCAIAITGWDVPEKTVAAGFELFLRKPIQVRILQDAIASVKMNGC